MKKLSTALLTAVLLAAAANANAADPATLNKPNVGAAVMYGIYTGEDEGDTGINPYGIGFGVNGGYTLDMSLHVGAGFNYFLGDSVDFPGGSTDINVYSFQGIVGYDLGLTPELVLRPQLGVGLSWASGEVCFELLGQEQCDSESESDFAITPGAKALYSFGGPYISGEVAFHYPFAENNASGLLLGIGGGLTF